MKMLYTIVVPKVALNTQRKSISTTVRKEPKTSCFNPPFSQTVKTNVVKLFFRLLYKHFPKSHSLYKIFNRNTIKVSYIYLKTTQQELFQ